jgi:hypothetical protein
MINFFRKIRQRLLSQNKFSKYLLYAIGEILLVVIGILIALQVNNWNNQKQNDLQAQKVLLALRREFIKNKAQLIQVKNSHERVVNASSGLLSLIANFPDNYNETETVKLLRDHGYYLSFDPFNGALETAVSSGGIHLIDNDSLVNLLFSWSSLISDSKEEETQARQLLFQQKKDQLFEYTREVDIWKQGKSPFSSDYVGLLKNPDFENWVVWRRGILQELVREQNDILEVNNSILHLIEKEIK